MKASRALTFQAAAQRAGRPSRARTVPNEVAQVLACGAAEAQVVMLRQMTNKGVGLSRAWLDRDHFQRLKSPQRTLDQLPGAGLRVKSSGSESARRI